VAEERHARATHPGPATVVSLACHPSARLWERRRDDADFLVVRVGLVDRPAGIALRPEPTGFGATHVDWPVPPTVFDVPVGVALTETGVLGVACGTRDALLAAARAMVAQVATLHAPEDLRIVVVTDPSTEADWAWADWLPHTGSLDDAPATLLVLDGVPTARAAELLGDGPKAGRYAFCLSADERSLPRACRATLVTDNATGTRATLRRAGHAAVTDVLVDGLVPGAAVRLARSLAPIRLAGADDAGRTVAHPAATRSVTVGPRPGAVSETTAIPRGER